MYTYTLIEQINNKKYAHDLSMHNNIWPIYWNILFLNLSPAYLIQIASWFPVYLIYNYNNYFNNCRVVVCCTIPTFRQIMLCIKNNKQHNKLFPEIKLHNKNKTDLSSNMMSAIIQQFIDEVFGSWKMINWATGNRWI